MKKILIVFVLVFVHSQVSAFEKCEPKINRADTIPSFVIGDFVDDYGIRYSVSDTLWTQHPFVDYHIISWNTDEQYIIARNGEGNPTEPGLYTRIDYMKFENMEPFRWGFCLTVYNATSADNAKAVITADRSNPRKGCGGYPFSRMKRK